MSHDLRSGGSGRGGSLERPTHQPPSDWKPRALTSDASGVHTIPFMVKLREGESASNGTNTILNVDGKIVLESQNGKGQALSVQFQSAEITLGGPGPMDNVTLYQAVE